MNQMRLDYVAARLCSSSYPPQQYRVSYLLDDYIHHSDAINDWDIFVGEGHEYNFAVFRGRGASSVLSWKEVIKACAYYFNPLRGNPYKLNRSHFEAWQQMSPKLYAAIQTVHLTQAQNDGVCKPWIFTGHALGGAMATIAAASYKPAALTTFAAPRVGGKKFVAEVEDACTWRRWVDGSDWTGMLPPRGHQLHGGDLYYIDSSGTLEINPSTKAQVFDHGKFWERHDIENYVEYIEEGLTSDAR